MQTNKSIQLSFPAADGFSRQGTGLDNTVTNNKYRLIKTLFKTEPERLCKNKVILSGHFIETYRYEKPVKINRRPGKKRKEPREELVEGVREARREEYRNRTKHRVIGVVQRLVESNFDKDSIFLTLTFNDDQKFDITDLKVCNSKLHDFIVKLRKGFENFKYLAVPEFQERGAVHYHLIINRSFIDKKIVEKFWKHGFIKISDIYYLLGIGNYFTKYLTKNSNDERLFGKRSFFTSKNFRRPKTVYGDYAEKIIDRLDQRNIAPYYRNSYKSEYNGVVVYEKYHIDTKI